MKTSVSIPDPLWDKVKDTGDGPSAVIQNALQLLVEQSSQPLASAPSAAARERLRPLLDQAVDRHAGEVTRLRETGYEFGVRTGATLDLADMIIVGDNPSAVGRDLAEAISELADNDVITSSGDPSTPEYWLEMPEDYEDFDLGDDFTGGFYQSVAEAFGHVLNSEAGPLLSRVMSRLSNRGLPDAFLSGAAAGLIDVRTAVLARTGAETDKVEP